MFIVYYRIPSVRYFYFRFNIFFVREACMPAIPLSRRRSLLFSFFISLILFRRVAMVQHYGYSVRCSEGIESRLSAEGLHHGCSRVPTVCTKIHVVWKYFTIRPMLVSWKCRENFLMQATILFKHNTKMWDDHNKSYGKFSWISFLGFIINKMIISGWSWYYRKFIRTWFCTNVCNNSKSIKTTKNFSGVEDYLISHDNWKTIKTKTAGRVWT